MNKEKMEFIALTTETECMEEREKCPKCVIANIEGWDCTLYGATRKLDENGSGIPERHKQCKDDFPGVIVMTAMKG